MVPLILAGVALAYSVFSGEKSKKSQRKQLLEQSIAEEDASARQEADLLAQRQAAADQIKTAGQREVLSYAAEAESIRQARLAAVETDVEVSTVSADEKRKRRAAFYEGSV